MNFAKPSERIPLSSKIGRDAIDTVSNITQDNRVMGDLASQDVGSLIAFGPEPILFSLKYSESTPKSRDT